jgi:hypothetical protein
MTDTLATVASPPTSADPGELGPSIAPAPAAAAKPPVPDAPRGTYEQRRQAQDQVAAKPAADAPIDPQAPQAPAAGEKFKVGKFEVSEEQIAGMMDRQAQDDLRKATIPPSADAYELKISPDAKLPGNVEFKFDGNDPSLVAAKNWAHVRGLDQGAFSEMLTLYAGHVAGQNAALAARSAQELAKAGVNAPQRVDAVHKWITGEMGEADAAPIRATLVTDAHLRFYEKLMQKASSQGVAGFSQQHRAAPETNTIPGYDKMSFEQRRQAQDQNAARRNQR